jgi:ring-1,2-phenylacetyl-CoA epoxidase subunit PaaC
MSDTTRTTDDLVTGILRLADDRLILGHRLSEWCGHAPILEEDIALANIALDLIGQATSLYEQAGTIEGRDRTADDLAFHRDTIEFRNCLLVEQPNGDFGVTIIRQYLFSEWSIRTLTELEQSTHPEIQGIAAKAVKETRYHLRHAREWVLRLGGGTDESRRRAQDGLDLLWEFAGELVQADDIDRRNGEAGVLVDPSVVDEPWREAMAATFDEAGLVIPDHGIVVGGGRVGRHTEHLGHLLAEMQILPRSHPGATW